MSSHTAIDLPSLSPPDSVETLDFETILAAMVADYQILQPDWDATVESDPVLKVLEVCAQREVVLRQQANDRVKAVLLAFASGTDLDHYAAGFGVERQIVTPADDSTSPPTPAVYESDARLRQRTQLALEGFTTAGPVGAYVFHAMSASPTVKDVDVSSPTPGVVLVVVLSTEGDGVPDAQLINDVTLALSDETVRPLCDTVSVVAAQITGYTIDATLTFYDGPDTEVVRAAAQAAAEAYAEAHHRLGHDITLSGLYAALHQPGVQKVSLTSPSADIVVANTHAARMTSISVTAGGTDE